jgi:hypothetical protein
MNKYGSACASCSSHRAGDRGITGLFGSVSVLWHERIAVQHKDVGRVAHDVTNRRGSRAVQQRLLAD